MPDPRPAKLQPAKLRGGLILMAVVTGIFPLSGCMSGSLASDSGPSGRWSTQNEQLVHVGEHVEFSFGISQSLTRGRHHDPTGIVDYCVAVAGDEYIEASLDNTGHYRFGFDVVGMRPGGGIVVRASAVRQKGLRDMRLIGSEWVQADDPFDGVDRSVARDSIQLTVYRSIVELPVPNDGTDLQFAEGRLEIVKSDGAIATITPGDNARQGFTVGEPNRSGERLIIYYPKAVELNKHGTTDVRFTVPDAAGRAHVFDGILPTP